MKAPRPHLDFSLLIDCLEAGTEVVRNPLSSFCGRPGIELVAGVGHGMAAGENDRFSR